VKWRPIVCFSTLIPALCCYAQVAAAAQSTLDLIKSRGVVTVCADPDNLPFSSSKLNPPGLDIEVAQAIAKQLNVKLDYYWYATNHGKRALRQLSEGNCDIFMGLPADPDAADSNPRILLSQPYYSGGFTPILPTGSKAATIADLEAKDVGVQMVTVPDVVLFNEGYSRRLFRTAAEVFSAVSKGEIEAGVITAPVAGWLARNNPNAGVRVSPETRADFVYPMGVGVRKQDTDLKAAVDKAITTIRADGRLQQILERYGVPQLKADGQKQTTKTAQADSASPSDAQASPGEASQSAGTISAPTSAKDIAAGRGLYRQACYKCHGPEGVSGGTIKDARKYTGTDAEFLNLVRNGRSGTAMPAWKGILSDTEIMQIRAYIKQLPKD